MTMPRDTAWEGERTLLTRTWLVAGLRLSKNARDGLMLAPGKLVWFVLTCLPIVLTPVVASIRSTDAAWGAVGPVAGIGIVALRHVVAPHREPR